MCDQYSTGPDLIHGRDEKTGTFKWCNLDLEQSSDVGYTAVTAITLPIKLYVALRVGVAVILSQPPTPGTIEYSPNRFCGETYVLAGVFVTSLLLVRMSPNTICVRACALVLAVVTCPFVFEGLEGELWRLGSHPTSDTKLMCFIHVLLNKQ